MICATEILTPSLEGELGSLLEDHWKEIAIHQDINILKPDYALYYAAQEKGSLYAYTLRRDGALVGYSVYFAAINYHYSDSLQARNDVIYVDPACRGRGSIMLLRYAEKELQSAGVDIIHMHMKVEFAHEKLFSGLGYKHCENIYEKVIKVEK